MRGLPSWPLKLISEYLMDDGSDDDAADETKNIAAFGDNNNVNLIYIIHIHTLHHHKYFSFFLIA